MSKHTRFEYLSILDGIQQRLRPRTYAEIGVRFGTSLRLALPGTRCVGIDPAADVRYPVPRGTQIFSSTSDDFFARHDLRHVLGDMPLDVGFIDGMHLFEFALRDFVNFERAATPDSVILVHDCYPIDAATATRERSTRLWSGDVWKLTLLLKDIRPDLSIATIDAAPTGLAIITNLDPDSKVLADDMDAIVAAYEPMAFDAIVGTQAASLNRIDATWAAIEPRLPRPFRATNVALLQAGRALRPPTSAQLRHRFNRLNPAAESPAPGVSTTP
jgi:hypothetical protein